VIVSIENDSILKVEVKFDRLPIDQIVDIQKEKAK